MVGTSNQSVPGQQPGSKAGGTCSSEPKEESPCADGPVAKDWCESDGEGLEPICQFGLHLKAIEGLLTRSLYMKLFNLVSTSLTSLQDFMQNVDRCSDHAFRDVAIGKIDVHGRPSRKG